MSETTVHNYEVTLTHPLLEGPFIAETIATTPERAASRIKMTAFHTYRTPAMLDATTTVVEIAPAESTPWIES